MDNTCLDKFMKKCDKKERKPKKKTETELFECKKDYSKTKHDNTKKKTKKKYKP